MKKTSLILILFLFCVANFAKAQDSYTLYFKMNSYKGTKAILYQIRGADNIPLDTCKKNLGAFVFYNIERYPAGMYRLRFDDTLFTEIIFNNEDIVIETDANDVLREMNVKKSVENTILFDYWKFAITIKDTILGLNVKQSEILRNNLQKENDETKAIDRTIEKLENENYNYVLKLKSQFPNAFAPKVLFSFQLPVYSRYLAEKGNKPYPSEEIYYLYHFFDNIDFSDERLLNTKIIFTSINDYLKTFANKPSTKVYNDLIDRVMAQVSVNPQVGNYVLNLFIKGFDNSIWEEVFIHLIDDYYLKSNVENPYLGVYYANKVEKMKALTIGKKFPSLILKDTNGLEINLATVEAKAIMVLFYASDCEHCLETLPSLIEIYESYKDQGFKVYGVALDSDSKLWKSVVKKEQLSWISVSDLSGPASSLLEQFNIWSTPKIFILDKDKIIRAKPNGIPEIHQSLLEILMLQK